MPELDTAAALWWAVIASGVYHGVNPGMGWPLAVSSALMERRATALPQALAALATGHFLSMTAILLPFSLMVALVDWHVDFALRHRPLIVVQDRDWESLPEQAREQVRALQRAYVDVWARELQSVHPGLGLEQARSMAHATFGLINSTPHSALLPDPAMGDLLHRMALGALGLEPAGVAQVPQNVT